jgi:DNA-binding MarR family transcriptional regulator
LVRHLRLSNNSAKRETGLSGAQIVVIQELARRSAASLTELARRTCTDDSSVSIIVSRLVRDGLAIRDRSGRDGRITAIMLTRKGREVAENAAPPDSIDRAVEQLPAEDRLRFAELLEQFVGQLGDERSP